MSKFFAEHPIFKRYRLNRRKDMNVLKAIKSMFTSPSSRLVQNKNKFSSPTVVNAFKFKYPNASAVHWQQIDLSKWHVNFNILNKWYSALFDIQGICLETITLASMESIPEVIQKNFEKSFLKSGIIDVRQVETSDKTIYEIKWTNGVRSWKLLYDVSGKIVGKLIA